MICAVCDAGPLTHLWQIRLWAAFRAFSVIHVSEQVAEEVRQHIDLQSFESSTGSTLIIHAVSLAHIDAARAVIPPSFTLQEADLATLATAQHVQPDFVLTDDLSLRRVLEVQGQTPMGSVGLVMYAYKIGLLNQDTLQQAIDALFVHSTLYLSPQFKAYIRKLIADHLVK
jgi:predicted nucleic acid-binding protein